MGLALAQVRLLALTSRKADVEMQIQLNSKRKTLLTREATQLSKLYYAKLQSSKIQYSTTNGYKDVNYNYLMAGDNYTFFDKIIDNDTSLDRKSLNSMILTDTFGRVILSDFMLNVVTDVLNREGSPDGSGLVVDGKELKPRTVETLTIDAMMQLLSTYSGKPESGLSTKAEDLKNSVLGIYKGTALTDSTDNNVIRDAAGIGMDILKHILRNGFNEGGTIYKNNDKYYTNAKLTPESEIVPSNGTFYTIKEGASTIGNTNGSMYWKGCGADNDLVPDLDRITGRQLAEMFSYYGAIFSAAFNGNNGHKNFNVAATLKQDADGDWVKESNAAYNTLISGDNLQNGLKSGVYQLVNVSSPATGGYARAQGLDYFKTQNYVVEKTDSSERETITAWYNAARADLSEKESYWDTEITSLSTELTTITTEIDSVKKLREDAIGTTFKWGGA